MNLDEEELKIAERFRQSHHALATYFALGYEYSKISRITGKSRRSLTYIYNNPMFRELIAQKVKVIEEEGHKATEELVKTEFEWRTIAMRNLIQAEQHIAEKLEQADHSGELLSVRDYNIITSDRADRLGYSKHTTVTHTHDFASQLDRAISRSNRQKQIEESKTIEGEFVSLPNFSNEPSAQQPIPVEPAPPVLAQRQKSSLTPLAASEPPSFVAALKRRLG